MKQKENPPEKILQDITEATSAKDNFKLIRTCFLFFLKEKPGIVILSSILLLLLWGHHGNFELLQFFIKSWSFPCAADFVREPIIPGIPWDREIISFFGGAFLVVVVPIFIIIFYFKQPVSMYGLGLPEKSKRKGAIIVFLICMAITSFNVFIGAKDANLQFVYPFYKSFTSVPQFLLYELCYFPFFLAIEFVFRGYLLFGIGDNPLTVFDKNNESTQVYLRIYAVIISMLAYNIWHLGKPLTELWSTPVWGIAVGIVTYAFRSIWPMLMVHALMNVLMDAFILHNLKILF